MLYGSAPGRFIRVYEWVSVPENLIMDRRVYKPINPSRRGFPERKDVGHWKYYPAFTN